MDEEKAEMRAAKRKEKTRERGQKDRATVIQAGRNTGRQTDKLTDCKVPVGSGEERKMEESGCEVICVAPTTPEVQG